MVTQKVYGHAIRKLRTNMKLTQSALGNAVGLSTSYISQIEKQNKEIPVETIPLFASAFRLSEEEFIHLVFQRFSVLINALEEIYLLLPLHLFEKAREQFETLTLSDSDLEHQDIHLMYLITRYELYKDEEIYKLQLDSSLSPRLKLRAYRAKAKIALDKSDFGSAQRYFVEAQDLLLHVEERHIDRYLFYFDIALFYKHIESDTKALVYFDKCIHYFSDEGYPLLLAESYLWRGVILLRQKCILEARESLIKAEKNALLYSEEFLTTIRLYLARVYIEEGRCEDGERMLIHIFNQNTNNEKGLTASIFLCQHYLERGDLKRFSKFKKEASRLFLILNPSPFLKAFFEELIARNLEMRGEDAFVRYQNAVYMYLKAGAFNSAGKLAYQLVHGGRNMELWLNIASESIFEENLNWFRKYV